MKAIYKKILTLIISLKAVAVLVKQLVALDIVLLLCVESNRVKCFLPSNSFWFASAFL